MTRDEIKGKVVDVVVEKLKVSRDQVTEESSFIDDLGADSLDTAELALEFEDEFDLQIPEDQQSLNTVGAVIDFIEKEKG